MRDTKYTYKLGKGCGVIDETLTLLSVFQEGMTKDSLAHYVHETNALSKCTDQRAMDLVRIVFFSRFMKNNEKTPMWLKQIRNRGLMLSQFKQLLMIYCARDNAIFYDFITEILNEARLSNETKLSPESIRKYVDNIVETGQAEWSESIRKRQVTNIKGVLADFDMMDKRGNILPYEPCNFTVLYLLHELHFEGLSDVAIWNHEDWQLLGLDKYQVQERIMELNLKGGFIAQCTGDLMTISWNYNSMEDFINGTL